MKETKKEERRLFLKTIIAGTAFATGAAAVMKPSKTAQEAVAERECFAETLYHESERFKKYYQTLRS